MALRQARLSKIGLRVAAAAAVAWPLAGAAQAQSLTISPVNMQLDANQAVTSMVVTNNGDAPTSFQVRPFAWSQTAAGDEQLTATRLVLVSPPLGVIAAGKSQTIRIMLRRPPQGRESSYRLMVDQLPGAQTPGAASMVLRFSIPVFAEPATPTTAVVRWSVVTRAGESFLVAVNGGARHANYWDMAIASSVGSPLALAAGGPQYLLAGATRSWKLTGPASAVRGVTFTLTAHSDQGVIKQAVSRGEGG
jgi:fimbrial chaperone protein